MEREWYRPLENSAMSEGWSLYRMEDGGVLSKPSDMFGNLYGMPILLEVKYHSFNNFKNYNKTPTFKERLFEDHQLEALRLWELNSNFSLGVAVVFSEHFPGEYHVWVNNINKQHYRPPDAVGATKTVTTKVTSAITANQDTDFFKSSFMSVGGSSTVEKKCLYLGDTIKLAFYKNNQHISFGYTFSNEHMMWALGRMSDLGLEYARSQIK